MSQNYYFFIASLPFLQMNAKPPFTLESFLNQAQEHLVKTDAALLRNIIFPVNEDDKVYKNSVVASWVQFNHQLRNELAWARALELNKEPARYQRLPQAIRTEVVDVIAKAIKETDPLVAERILDQARWSFIEELTKEDYFNVEWLIAYALKLKMLHRHEIFKSDEGKKVFVGYQQFEIPMIA